MTTTLQSGVTASVQTHLTVLEEVSSATTTAIVSEPNLWEIVISFITNLF